jgi:hypothetical protein
VHRLGGVQAQDFEATLWSLGRRTGERRAAVLARFEAGEFVRTHALRQTWHFVHRDDLTRVQAATAHRVQRLNAPYYLQQGLDGPVLARAGDVIRAVTTAGPATRAEVGAGLSAAGIDVSGLRLGFVMMWAELECLVVSGPLRGKQHTYVSWPDPALPERAEAVAWLVRRFFASHGPATPDDFAAWSSLTRTQTREALAVLPAEHARVDGVDYVWFGDAVADAWASPQVELLNGYDEYVSGVNAEGKRRLDRARLVRRRPNWPIGLVTVDGQLAGNWRRTNGRSGVVVDVLPLRPFARGEATALDAAASAYGDFLGVPVDLRLLPP